MRMLLVLFVLIFFSCGGSLSDEQRKQMREKMEENKIVRVTDVEITEAAFAKGRKITSILDSLNGDSSAVNSFLAEQHGNVHFIKPGEGTAHLLEQQLVDAYL